MLTHIFSNHNITKFVLLWQKGVYPCEYMNNWGKCNEKSPEKNYFYSSLNTEDTTDSDDKQAKGACKDFKIQNLVEYHDLYVQSYTLLLADVFNKF